MPATEFKKDLEKYKYLLDEGIESHLHASSEVAHNVLMGRLSKKMYEEEHQEKSLNKLNEKPINNTDFLPAPVTEVNRDRVFKDSNRQPTPVSESTSSNVQKNASTDIEKKPQVKTSLKTVEKKN